MVVTTESFFTSVLANHYHSGLTFYLALRLIWSILSTSKTGLQAAAIVIHKPGICCNPLLSLWENKNKSQIFNSRYSEHLSVYFLTEWLKSGFLVKVLCSKRSWLFFAESDHRGVRCLCWKMEVLWYQVSHTDLIQQKGIYTTLWQQVNGGNTNAMGIASI